MLIKIDTSVIAQLNAPGSSEEVSVALEQLAYGQRYGRHELSGGLDVFSALAKSPRLSAVARSVYLKMYGRAVQTGRLSLEFDLVVHLISGAGAPMVRKTADRTIIEVPVETFACKALTEKTILLCENLSDAGLYRLLGQFYLSETGLTAFYLASEPQGGGGSTIADAFEEIQATEERFCLCITDSDVTGPGGPVGDTARRVSQKDDPSKPLSTSTHLRVRAMENLLSVAILEEIAKYDTETRKKVEAFVNIRTSKHGEALRFSNFKDGISLEKILKIPSTSPIRHFWMSIASDYQMLGSSIEAGCLPLSDCPNLAGCSCILIPGLGKGIVQKAIDHVIRRRGAGQIKPLLDFITGPEWHRVGRLVAEWCFASAPMSAT